MSEEAKSSTTAAITLNTTEGEQLKTAEGEQLMMKLVTAVEEEMKKVTITEEKEQELKKEEPKKVKLKTVDEVIFEVEPSIVKEIGTLRPFAEDDDVVPVPNLCSRELRLVIEYISERSREVASGGDLVKFEDRFVAARSTEEVKELLVAASYLDMKHIPVSGVANMIKNKSVEFVRNFFGVVNDFTPEEEARVRQETAWAFEGVEF